MEQTKAKPPHESVLTNPDGKWKYTNALASESSPYLLQHAHNPVNWYSWGPETFELARKAGKPLFLSVGYSTCYWCHVMERKVFSEPVIAALMNQWFVNIKVDREERPDLDQIYMIATQLVAQGRGGWPNVFLTSPGTAGPDDPGLKPFFAGTYFPPQPQQGMPSFPQILEGNSEAWCHKRQEVLDQASRIAEAVRDHLSAPVEAGQLDIDMVQLVTDDLLRSYDPTYGGFGRAPKFPQPANLLFLLKVFQNNPNDELWKALAYTLDRMARGGMYDQIGGGFHRYSTDEKWLVPHFEKMLYDNGQLVEVYCIAHTIKPPEGDAEFYPRVVRQVCDYVLREMTDPTGTFWSAQDAEVDACEGGNYVWTADEMGQAIGDQKLAKLAAKMYGFDDGSNFRDPHAPDADWVNVLYLPHPLHDLARSEGMSLENLLKMKAEIDVQMLGVRDDRKQPATDDKVLVSWNGLMIGALARGGRTLREPRYTQAAAKGAAYILDGMCGEDGGLYRTMRRGTVKIPAFLEDYAFCVHGLLELYRGDKNSRWLEPARQLMDIARSRFATDVGGYYDTLDGQADLFVRTRSTYDGAVCSGNSQMAHNLLDLYELTGEVEYLQQVIKDLESFAVPMKQQGMGMIHMHHALLRKIELARAQFEQQADTAAAPTLTKQAIGVNVEPKSIDVPSAGAPLRVTLKVDEEYHINAYDPGLDGLIPTTIELTNGAGLSLDVNYPEGQTKHYPFGDKPINVYEGRVVLEATIRRVDEVAKDVRPKLTLTYQMCTDHACLGRKTIELPVEIRCGP